MYPNPPLFGVLTLIEGTPPSKAVKYESDSLLPEKIIIVPPNSVISKWEEDYNKMQTMIYGKPLSFNEIINKIKQLNEKLNKLKW